MKYFFNANFYARDIAGPMLELLKDTDKLNSYLLLATENYGKLDPSDYKILSSALSPDSLLAVKASLSDLPASKREAWLRLITCSNLDPLFNYRRYKSLIEDVNTVFFNGYPYGEAFPVGYCIHESIFQGVRDYENKKIIINWIENISVDYASAGESFFEQSVMSLPDSVLDRWFVYFIYDSIIWSEETKRRKIQAAVDWWWLCVPPC